MFEPRYSPRLPDRARPVCIIGAGSIVRDAHLPAYALAGFPVHAITNRFREQAEDLAAVFQVRRAAHRWSCEDGYALTLDFQSYITAGA